MVSAWAEPVKPGDTHRVVVVANRSEEPVYELNVFLAPRHFALSAQNTFRKSLIPPMTNVPTRVKRQNPAEGQRSVPRVEVAFADRNGQRWLRRGNGSLTNLQNDDWNSHWSKTTP
jgi:hypothetical protein